ncbi:uncharacterized protein HaLaN_04904 [Haematococcus lacustris]|uniref:Uncharacterized protein n=1 Tax=Haematococcus lacustris TaxID=44745 RepID=A0A699Z2V2_HAELA|nr:uncharacterized protein HaLaN_04904 [Haematococcus lacustris]
MKGKKRKGAAGPKQPKPNIVVCRYGLIYSSPELCGTPLETPEWQERMAFHRQVLTGVLEDVEEAAAPRDPADSKEPEDPDAPLAITQLPLHRRILYAIYVNRSKLTRSQVQHDSGLNQARLNTQRWNDNIKLELQHLAAATPAGTSLVAIRRHVAVTLATWDAVWGEYLHPKWAEQKMRLHGAQERVLERYFKKLEEEAASVSQQEWGTRKQLVVFFGSASIGTRGGWGAKAVLQACRKVVERPNSGKPTDRVPGKVVTVNDFRTSRVSSILNSPQPCEEDLDSSKPTRPEGWKPKPGQVQDRLLRSALEQAV